MATPLSQLKKSSASSNTPSITSKNGTVTIKDGKGNTTVTTSSSRTSSGSSGSGKTVQVAAGGNAPQGTQIGDTVVTAGGNYKVVAPNTPGASYNPSSGLWSVKVTGSTSSSPSSNSTNPWAGTGVGVGPAGSATAYSSGSQSATTAINPSGYYSGTNTGYIDRGPNMSQGTYGYNSAGTFYDQVMSQADLAAINSLKAQYEIAKSKGDTAGMQAANNAANEIRAGYGYYGGTDGSLGQKIELPQDIMPQVGLPIYEAQVGAVNNTYDAALKAAMAALNTAYDRNKAEAEALKAKIPAIYQEQANTVAASAAKDRLNFNEMAAANGLNSGTGSQASLAMNNALQNNLGAVRTAEGNAMAQAERDLSLLYIEYQNAIAQAVANNEYERAASLLSEYQRQAQSVVDVAQAQAALNLDIAGFNRGTNQYNTELALNQQATNYQQLISRAETLAQFGDFTGYKALGYTDAEISRMQSVWRAANQDIAWALGYY